MNFQEFQLFRSQKLAEKQSIIDFAETNLWRSLAALIPVIAFDRAEHVHRCHLAQEWLAAFGMPMEWSKRAFVSSGVRHSLSLIFSILADKGVDLRIPKDVYPVYGQLAENARLAYQTFPTLPELRFPNRGDYLLISNPLKPAGRWLTHEEVSQLCDWLRVDDRRRVLLDTVYNFDTRWHSTTRDLLKTEQVILLHSLSKGWLSPLVFGVALVPDRDIEQYAATFRQNSPTQENLLKARCLLRDYSRCPQAVAQTLLERREKAIELLPSDVRSAILLFPNAEPEGYLMSVRFKPAELLSRHSLLAIPLTVFGSDREDCSVLSTLNCQ